MIHNAVMRPKYNRHNLKNGPDWHEWFHVDWKELDTLIKRHVC